MRNIYAVQHHFVIVPSLRGSRSDETLCTKLGVLEFSQGNYFSLLTFHCTTCQNYPATVHTVGFRTALKHIACIDDNDLQSHVLATPYLYTPVPGLALRAPLLPDQTSLSFQLSGQLAARLACISAPQLAPHDSSANFSELQNPTSSAQQPKIQSTRPYSLFSLPRPKCL